MTISSRPIAAVGLGVSGSHGSGEIAYNLTMLFADMRIGHAGDEAISESRKCMDLAPVDGSSVNSFSFAVRTPFHAF